jgi:hypothetical protein
MPASSPPGVSRQALIIALADFEARQALAQASAQGMTVDEIIAAKDAMIAEVAARNAQLVATISALIAGLGTGGGGTPTDPTDPTAPITVPAFTMNATEVEFVQGTQTGELIQVSAPPSTVIRQIVPPTSYLSLNNAGTAVNIGVVDAPAGDLVFRLRDTSKVDSLLYFEREFRVKVKPKSVVISPTLPSSRLFDSDNYFRPLQGGSDAGVTYTPTTLIRSAEGELFGRNFNAGPVAMAAAYDLFAVSIERGLLQPNQFMEYVLEGESTPVTVQMGVKSLHDDGSVLHARVGMMHPALAPRQTKRAMFRVAASGPTGANVVVGDQAGNPFSFTAKLNGRYGNKSDALVAANTTYNLSVAEMVATGTRDTDWMVGPLVTEARFTKNLTDSLRAELDLAVFKDGSCKGEIKLKADLQMWNNSAGDWKRWSVDLTGAQGGANFYSALGIAMSQGQIIGKKFWSKHNAATNGQRIPPFFNIQVDAPLLTQQFLLPIYNYEMGIFNYVLGNYKANQLDQPWFMAPLSGNGIDPAMGGQGARDDIGWQTGWTAAWAQSQTYEMAALIEGMARGEYAFPIHSWNQTNNTRLSIFADLGGYPDIWWDDRGYNTNPPNYNLVDNTRSGWQMDIAHMPQVCYIAWLLTGDRSYYDLFESHTMFVMMKIWPFNRRAQDYSNKDWSFAQTDQVRESAWAVCHIAMAARNLPDSSPFKSRLLEVLNYTFKIINNKAPAWKVAQGEWWGWLAGSNPYNQHEFKPWQQEHFAVGVAESAVAGSSEALKFMDWMRNYLVGRALQPENVFSIKDCAAYRYETGNAHNVLERLPTVRTWAQLRAAIPFDHERTASGWVTGGNYPQLALRTFAIYGALRKDPDVDAIRARFLSEDSGFTGKADYRKGPIEAMAPLVWKPGRVPAQPAEFTPAPPTDPEVPGDTGGGETGGGNTGATDGTAINLLGTTATRFHDVFATYKLVPGSFPCMRIMNEAGDQVDVPYGADGWAAPPNLVAFQQFGTVRLVGMYSQLTGQLRMVPMGRNPLLARDGVVNTVGGRVGLRLLDGLSMGIPDFNIGAVEFGLVIAAKQLFLGNGNRLASFIAANDGGEDWNGTKSGALLAQANDKGLLTGRGAAGGVFTATDANYTIPDGAAFIGSCHYTADGRQKVSRLVAGQTVTNTAAGTPFANSPFGRGELRFGGRVSAAEPGELLEEFLGNAAAWLIVASSNDADMASMRGGLASLYNAMA